MHVENNMKRQTQSKDLNIGDEEGGNLRNKYVDTYVATFYEIRQKTFRQRKAVYRREV